MSDSKADSVPWTIKSVPVEVRHKAVNAARAADQTMGEWITEVVNRATDPHTANQVILPDKHGGKPVVKREVVPMPDVDLPGLAAALTATIATLAAAGEKPPKNLGQNATATLNKYMRAARGLSERDGKTKRQTIQQNGQTMELIEGSATLSS